MTQDYKSTLNLPKTDFSMRADLPRREPQALDEWKKQDLYREIIKARKGGPSYVLHDGPPYANGNIHMGHVLNKVLKDIVVKYKTQRGYYSPYVPGWDCHGLPVEHQLFKELKSTKEQIGQVEFRKKAHRYAMKYVDIQREQFKRLGIFGNWADPYLTLSKQYEADIVRSFSKLVHEGYVYKGLKPVNWCYVCETALAEAEVEYTDHTSPSIYVKFKLKDTFKVEGLRFKGDVYFVIWTTTPWTLVANVAVAVHPDLDYAAVKVKDEVWVLMKDLVAPSMEKAGIKEYEIVKTVKGKEMEGSICKHPFIDRESKVVLADYVSMFEGTGCVHTAPGHGQEDYLTGKRYKLPTVMPVDAKGKFDATAGEFSGLNVHKANKNIIETLQKTNNLISSQDVSHSYPHCWRCKQPIIFRATPQWFMSVDHKELRKRLRGVIDKGVKWVPASGRERMASMVANRPDWCLSRQRYWGVPIVAFYCEGCEKELLDAKVIDHVADLIEKEGADAWFIRKEDELVPKGTACKGCGGNKFKKETDIIDVWFDSGISHQAVLKRRAELSFPCELYLEGSDQYRGWFQSALITSMGIDDKSPFKTVLTHGFVVDGNGRKMSKSLGNVISPLDVIKNFGADIMRLWVASSDYREDVRLSDQILTRLADAYRKIRNTYRFILGNLNGFDPETDMVTADEMFEIDRWALSETYKLIESVTKHYEAFSFHNVFHEIYNFCVIELSSFYLDILKDRLYIFGTKSIQRRSAQTALFEIVNVICKQMAPIMVFTTNEVWKSLYKEKNETIYLSDWPDAERLKKFHDKGLEKKWEYFIKLRADCLKVLEFRREKGIIGSSLEACVELYSPDEKIQDLLKRCQGDLPAVFIVSKVKICDSEPEGGVKSETQPLVVNVTKAPGGKCKRCWNYSEFIGKDDSHPALCKRCVEIVKGEN